MQFLVFIKIRLQFSRHFSCIALICGTSWSENYNLRAQTYKTEDQTFFFMSFWKIAHKIKQWLNM